MIPCFVLPISRLPDVAQKTICTQNVAMDVTFNLKYVPAFFYPEKSTKKCQNPIDAFFLGHPVAYAIEGGILNIKCLLIRYEENNKILHFI